MMIRLFEFAKAGTRKEIAAMQADLRTLMHRAMEAEATARKAAPWEQSAREAVQREHAAIAKVVEVTARATHAESIARGQAKHIEALQASNDKMLQAITDMRRVGFSLPDDILREPANEHMTTVQDDDREYVAEHPHLTASDFE